MKNCLLLGLVLMVGIVVANDNSSAPYGFVPGVMNSVDSSIPITPFSAEDNSMEESNSRVRTILPESPGTDGFTFSEVNWSSFDWFGPFCRGLDVVNHGGEMLMSPAYTSDSILFINFNDGTKYDAIRMDPGNSLAWGSYVYGSVNVNDCSNGNIYHSTDLGSTWSTYTNPASTSGRGMDMDYSTSLVWETSGSNGVYSFSHLAATGTFYDLSAVISDQLSGLTTYENGGYHLLIVNTYSTGYAYFFDLDDNLNYLGAAGYPYPVTNSYGLTYCESRDTFFWAMKSANTGRYLIELQLDITSLEQSTWADIKSSF